MHIKVCLEVHNIYIYIYAWIYIICIRRHTITEYENIKEKINKSYIFQKLRCFLMHGSIDTNCLCLIILE